MQFGVVIVTFNRLEKLKKCLLAYQNQTFSPKIVFVFDNASTDGTREYLDQWITKESECNYQRKVIHSDQNLGGSGGFAEGIRYIQQFKTDWIWLADDDAYPEPECLAMLSQYYNGLTPIEREKISALCAKVINNIGNISPLHRRILCKNPLQIKEIPISENDFKYPATEIDFLSFVGVAIKYESVQIAGLPRRDYFIYFDDSEYSLRLHKHGKLMCIPNAKIIHDSPENTIQRYSWKNYYMFRNKIFTYFTYFPSRFAIAEIVRTCFMIFRHYNCLASWKQFFRAIHAVCKNSLGKDFRYIPQNQTFINKNQSEKENK